MLAPGTARRTGSLSRRRAVRLAAMTIAGSAGATVAHGVSAAQEATPAAVPPDFKVVLHAAQADHWDYVLSNVRNLMQEWPAARLRVVVDGNAVNALTGESDLTLALATAIAHGLELYVCPNALREHGIPAGEVSLDANVELGGVVALVLAAREGHVYVKP